MDFVTAFTNRPSRQLLTLLAAGLALHVPLGQAQDAGSSITVEVDERAFDLYSKETRYADEGALFRSQPWWGDAELAVSLADEIRYRLGDFNGGDGSDSGIPSALVAYGTSSGGDDGSVIEGEEPVREDVSGTESVSIAYWDGEEVHDCPSGCPSVDDQLYYVFSEHAPLLVSLEDIYDSLVGTSRGVGATLRSSALMIHGLHSRPLSRMVEPGERTVWLGGDYGRQDYNSRDGRSHVVEVGAGHNLGWAQFNLSVGRTAIEEDLPHGGDADGDSQFVYLEGIVPVTAEAETVYATLGGFYQAGDIDIRRGYEVNGERDYSSASPDTSGWGARARLDWVDAAKVGSAKISPYADLSYRRLKMDGYTETGGDFPAEFEKRDEGITEARLGAGLTHPLPDPRFDVVAVAEAAHRFNDDTPAARGELTNGLLTFDVEGEDYDQTWLRGGVGIEGQVGPGRISLMLNGTTEGEMESTWVTAAYQVTF